MSDVFNNNSNNNIYSKCFSFFLLNIHSSPMIDAILLSHFSDKKVRAIGIKLLAHSSTEWKWMFLDTNLD